MSAIEPVVHRYQGTQDRDLPAVDPITTQIIRNSLISIGSRMKSVICRTAVSPSLYDMLDFSAALYDRHVRLLAQGTTMPLFMGSLVHCIKAAVEAVGGEHALEPGDLLLYNLPYNSGTHANDVALVKPVFIVNREANREAKHELIGYAAVRAHWIDIGGLGSYSTNSQDVFMEGVLYPGVKLYSRGERNEDVYRIIKANTRVPDRVAGDLHAEVNGCEIGAAGLVSLVERYGFDLFSAHVEHMFNAGEAMMRKRLEAIPDGRYEGDEMMDSNGITDEPVPVKVIVEVRGSSVRIDYTECPPAQPGPINSPLPGTISISRIAVFSLIGAGQTPNEGHFRPIEVVTRPGSMFHPLPPSPCFLYAWPELIASEAINHALSDALPDSVPAGSGADFCIVAWWGVRENGTPWGDGIVARTGMGAHANGDGWTGQSVVVSGTQQPPVEVWEAKNPWLFEKLELAPDSCGPGRFQGGLGVDVTVHVLEDSMMTNTVEHTRSRPWGLFSGGSARSNQASVQLPGEVMRAVGKLSAFPMPKGSVLAVNSGGGGGYGSPADRNPERVRADLEDGYITEDYARQWYGHCYETH